MCSKSIAKIILVAFNIGFVILGAVGLGLGIFVYVKRDDFGGVLAKVPVGDQSTEDALNNPSVLEASAIVLMVAGGFLFLVGFLGCCGAIKEWKIFLILYIIIVTIILLLQLAGAIAAFFFGDKVEDKLLDFLEDTIKKEYVKGVRIVDEKLQLGDEEYEIAWDLVQVTFECCGANNYTDWDTATNFVDTYSGTYNGVVLTGSNAKVPITCCKVKDIDVYPDDLDKLEFEDVNDCLTRASAASTNQVGCYESVKDEIMENSLIISIVGIVIVVMEILGLIAAIYLCCNLEKD